MSGTLYENNRIVPKRATLKSFSGTDSNFIDTMFEFNCTWCSSAKREYKMVLLSHCFTRMSILSLCIIVCPFMSQENHSNSNEYKWSCFLIVSRECQFYHSYHLYRPFMSQEITRIATNINGTPVSNITNSNALTTSNARTQVRPHTGEMPHSL